MDKKTIPAEVIARQAKGQPSSASSAEQPFDPQFHEAVGVRAEPAHADHAVLEVWQRGWVHGKELFRPAKVVVNDLRRSNPAGNPANNHHEKAE